jgi:hypothetical protein
MRKFCKFAVAVAVTSGLTIGVAAAKSAWYAESAGPAGGRAMTLTMGVIASAAPGKGDALPNLATGDATPTGTIGFSVTNTSSIPLRVSSIAANGAVTASVAGCAAHAQFNGASINYTAAQMSLPVSKAARSISVVALALDNTTPSVCQGATFTIPVLVRAVDNR